MDVNQAIRAAVRSVPDFPKPGILFRDITPILENPVLSRGIIDTFIKNIEGVHIDAVAGVESRGFLFGLPLAMALNVPFIMVRKKGKLPAETVSLEYDLEYGTAEIEVHKGAIKPGMQVLVHDDLLATGGTARATTDLIAGQKADIAGFSFLIELNFLGGRKKLAPFNKPVISLVRYED